MMSFAAIQTLLESTPPELLAEGTCTHASVALVLRASATGPEVLFIERAQHEGDPWSGDLGFPGGKVEKEDGEERRAAERETLEEIGLGLEGARYLGRLSDISGVHFPVRVSCFVYGLTAPSAVFSLSAEVRTFFWVPLANLLDSERHLTAPVHFSGKRLDSPAIRILEPGNIPLWGITYRLVMQFLQLLGHQPLPAPSFPGILPATPEK